ncbi:peptidoglycan/xylan/chitin deacetylase (PgdA/CDA1 family) [Pedobacter sp. AK017]|uniref:polysaccharide deacetylase family protein n=1 Tax=Pedobacter sp. AK017 TaxID=2723073 RepID=UPI00161FFB57|nr:polysaccharide deacetylase family protein [Pedobacter sp. AK017]MBB5440366.1 peptidoglycan/xylan/chitin deacetylase (PgdA/CDA1 family) [Pedobacter sp. AK017]
MKNKFARRGVVLMYHRIAKPISDPWDLAVSPENFEEHLKVLKAYNVISVNELADILAQKSKMQTNTVVVTFDDGYRDNYLAAKPLLEKYNIPASFFMTTGSIGKQKEFWWDALERICLQSAKLPDKLTLEEPDKISWDIGNSDIINVLSPLDLYLKLCDIVRKMPAIKHQAFIKFLETWANNINERPAYFTMDEKELLDLQSNKLFTIGAHTVTHPFLPNFSCDYQKKEIQESINFLKDLTGDEINYLAYPHGGHNQSTMDIMSQLNLKLAFTTNAACFTSKTYAYTIPRFQVKNWDGDTFVAELKNWMNQIF